MRKELKYYGFYACLQLWDARPHDVIRVYLTKNRVKEVSPLLKWCAKNSKAYHIISEEEMAKVSDSIHHEGLCILAKELPTITFPEVIAALRSDKNPTCLIYLDGVQNPHNIGSILRVSAHFGIPYILGEKTLLPKISPSAYRVAQGGAEFVKLVPIDHFTKSIQQLEKLGFQLITSSSHGENSLYQQQLPARTILALGSESEGINDAVLKLSKKTLLIPGTGQVESLNVAVATGLFLGEYWRQHGQ